MGTKFFRNSDEREAQTPLRAVFRVGAVEIDPAQESVRLNGVEQHLRRKAFAVLLTLLEQRHRVVTKQELIESIWQDTAVCDDALVQCIVEIRKILGDDPRNPNLVKTLPKVGYRFIGPVEIIWESHDPPPGRADQAKPARHFPWTVAVSSGLLIIAVSLGFRYGFTRATPGSSSVQAARVSIAVLPFANLTGNPEFEYQIDGLTDEITNRLISTRQLRVVARSSAFRFKGKPEDVRPVGRSLNADTILEGSIRKSGDRARVITQLSRAADGYQLWSKEYERNWKDLSAISSDLAIEVAAVLNVEVRPGTRREASVQREAHDLYLRGRHLWYQRRAVDKSIEYFEAAIRKEPAYAQAYAGLADAYAVMVLNGYPGAGELAPKAKAAARKAVELDRTLADPHAALGSILSCYDWDWNGAEVEFRQAITLNPDSSTAHHWFGTHLIRVRRFDEAVRELEAAWQLDPLSPMIQTNLGEAYGLVGKHDRALERYRAVLELDPDFLPARLDLGDTMAEGGMYERAVAEFKRLYAHTGEPVALECLAYVYAISGRTAEARKLVREIENGPAGKVLSTFQRAGIHAMIGEEGRAFELLDQSFIDRSDLANLQNDGRWEKLRDDRRYKAVLKKVGFPGS